MRTVRSFENEEAVANDTSGEKDVIRRPGGHDVPLQIAEGDLVVSRIIGRGVHAGELFGIPATNKEVETEGIAIHRVRDGKIR
jgi:predicted ester cyclase